VENHGLQSNPGARAPGRELPYLRYLETRDGRAFLYRALCSREQLSSHFLHKLYDGAVDQLVLNMLSSEKLSNQELLELESLIAQARQQRKQTRKKGK
jgi:BlaI family penicillinase repressor